MKNLLFPLIVYAFFVFCLNAQQTTQSIGISEKEQAAQLQPLSEREADAVVRQRALDTEIRKSQRLINRIDFKVLERKSVNMGDRKVLLNRVAPPNLTRVEPPTLEEPVERRTFTEEQIAGHMALNEKPHEVLMLSATVYDREMTKLKWGYGEDEMTAWSNVDFNYVRGVITCETDDAHYTLLMGISNLLSEEIDQLEEAARERGIKGFSIDRIPKLPAFTPNRAEYFVITDDDALIERDDLFDPIDAIHAHYEQNADELHIQYQRYKALRLANKRYEEANPEKPEDTIINFWPKRGSAYNNPNR